MPSSARRISVKSTIPRSIVESRRPPPLLRTLLYLVPGYRSEEAGPTPSSLTMTPEEGLDPHGCHYSRSELHTLPEATIAGLYLHDWYGASEDQPSNVNAVDGGCG